MATARESSVEAIEIRPQPGPQEAFLSTPADIAIYGGAAGGGKTWAELLEPLRHINNPEFGAVIFRRTYPMIMRPGGLWDEAGKLYPLLGAEPNKSDLSWNFPSGAKVQFAHMQFDRNMYDWQGSQIALIEFDELTHFGEPAFFYMMSRNRSMCGVRPYMRGTCNPDPESWVARFIEWWIDQDTGLAIPERSGIVRYFLRVNEQLEWADSAEELCEHFPDITALAKPKSATFIPASVHDNKKLLEANPEYLANLMAQPLVERERLLGGNWKIKVGAGKIFNREWFETLDSLPIGPQARQTTECLFWDFAATKKTLAKPDPDFTVGVLMRRIGNLYIIMDVIARQIGPADVEKLFIETSKAYAARAKEERVTFRVRWEVEPGSAGIRESARLTSLLAGVDASGVPSRGDKITRAKALAAQTEAGFVKLLRDTVSLYEGRPMHRWNERFLEHMHHQPDWPHDDEMDGASGAFNDLVGPDEVRVYGEDFSIY